MAKRVVVFGGTRGIGFAIARKFLAENFSVAVLSRSAANVQESLNLLRKQSLNTETRVSGHICDVSSEANIKESFAVLLSESDRIDVLVNAAGINFDNLLVKAKSSEISSVIQTNLIGPILTCKYSLRQMLRQRSGSIVNIGKHFDNETFLDKITELNLI